MKSTLTLRALALSLLLAGPMVIAADKATDVAKPTTGKQAKTWKETAKVAGSTVVAWTYDPAKKAFVKVKTPVMNFFVNPKDSKLKTTGKIGGAVLGYAALAYLANRYCADSKYRVVRYATAPFWGPVRAVKAAYNKVFGKKTSKTVAPKTEAAPKTAAPVQSVAKKAVETVNTQEKAQAISDCGRAVTAFVNGQGSKPTNVPAELQTALNNLDRNNAQSVNAFWEVYRQVYKKNDVASLAVATPVATKAAVKSVVRDCKSGSCSR